MSAGCFLFLADVGTVSSAEPVAAEFYVSPESPVNPVLRASDEDRQIANPRLTEAQRQRIAKARNINNSDLDFCEYKGHLIINYSWGNQQGVEHLAEAVYEGTQEQFLRGWFPQR